MLQYLISKEEHFKKHPDLPYQKFDLRYNMVSSEWPDGSICLYKYSPNDVKIFGYIYAINRYIRFMNIIVK